MLHVYIIYFDINELAYLHRSDMTSFHENFCYSSDILFEDFFIHVALLNVRLNFFGTSFQPVERRPHIYNSVFMYVLFK